jgi:hypothetical protein
MPKPAMKFRKQQPRGVPAEHQGSVLGLGEMGSSMASELMDSPTRAPERQRRGPIALSVSSDSFQVGGTRPSLDSSTIPTRANGEPTAMRDLVGSHSHGELGQSSAIAAAGLMVMTSGDGQAAISPLEKHRRRVGAALRAARQQDGVVRARMYKAGYGKFWHSSAAPVRQVSMLDVALDAQAESDWHVATAQGLQPYRPLLGPQARVTGTRFTDHPGTATRTAGALGVGSRIDKRYSSAGGWPAAASRCDKRAMEGGKREPSLLSTLSDTSRVMTPSGEELHSMASGQGWSHALAAKATVSTPAPREAMAGSSAVDALLVMSRPGTRPGTRSVFHSTGALSDTNHAGTAGHSTVASTTGVSP